ncbi:MAG: ABC transporter substrate-binding protein [Oscillospiraceae bacterium]
MIVNAKRAISAILACIMIFSITACSKGEKDKEKEPQKANTKVIVDQSGRKVEIPKEIKSVAFVYGVATSFLIALDVGDRVVAANAGMKFYTDACPALEDAGTVGRRDVDLEALAKYKPDIFIHKAADTKTIEAVEKLGIPTVAIAPESMTDILETIKILGEVFGKQDRAKEIINYYNEKINFSKNLVKDIPQEKRKTAIMMGSELGRIAGGDMLQSFLIETAGGINSAKDIKNDQIWMNVGVEKVFQWNPDFIFCTNSASADYSLDRIMKDPAWQGMTAVKQKHMLTVPSNMDSWEFPGMSSLLGAMWMLSQMYPEKYSEQDFLKEIDSFYQFVYGKTFDRDYLGY